MYWQLDRQLGRYGWLTLLKRAMNEHKLKPADVRAMPVIDLLLVLNPAYFEEPVRDEDPVERLIEINRQRGQKGERPMVPFWFMKRKPKEEPKIGSVRRTRPIRG